MADARTIEREYTELNKALRFRKYEAATELAKRLPHLTLIQALELTLLAAPYDPERYERMAVRWIRLLLAERVLSLHDLEWLAARFQGRVEKGDDVLVSVMELVKSRPRRQCP